ncbi:MAG: periplasmic heavy metal sensor [bacterium]|nr:periplasmic heavy metal sensor [bacterium]
MERGLKSWKGMSAVAVFTITLAVAGIAGARPQGGTPGCGTGPRGLDQLEHGLARLDLDDEQRSAAFALLDDARAARREQEPVLHEAHEKMRSLLDESDPDEATVLAQIETLGALRLEARKAEFRTLLALRELLGTEPWEALNTCEGRGDRGPGRREDRGDRGPGRR